MDRLKEISGCRDKAHRKLLSLKSKVYEAFLEMEKGGLLRWGAADGEKLNDKISVLYFRCIC